MRLAIIVTIAISIFLMVGISIAQKDSQQTSDKPKEMPKEIIGKDGVKMVLIPAGEFQMGTDLAEIPKLAQNASLLERETPRHTVYVDAFYIDACEVTNAQYRKFVQVTGHKEPEGLKLTLKSNNTIAAISGFKPWTDPDYNKDNQPVVCVSWDDAKAYAEWAGERLPTEAEWEKAGRGGSAGKRYVWGDEWPPPKNSGNFSDWKIIDGYDDGYVYTAPVGSYKPNGYGLYDMASNVWEWCADWYDDKYYANSLKSNPKGPDSGQDRVLRGGSWYLLFNTDNLRVAYRFSGDPPFTSNIVGFRCVVSATP